MSDEHEHDWQVSPLIAYVATEYDGPNYRSVRLQICSKCWLLRLDNGSGLAGHKTWDSAEAASALREKARA